MKKLYLMFTLFICFFVFSLKPSAEGQDNLTTSSGNLTQLSLHNKSVYYDCNNLPPKYSPFGFGSVINMFGYNLSFCYMNGSTRYKFNNYHDYYCSKHLDDSYTCDTESSRTGVYFNTMYSMGENLIYYLESLLPENAVKNNYYFISYVTSVNSYLDLFLIYLPGSIEYSDLDGLKGFVISACDEDIYGQILPDNCEAYNPTMKTYVYRFKVTTDISYLSYTSVTYKDILANFNFGESIVQKYNIDNKYYIAPYFYNFFYMSNFSIFPNTSNLAFVPGYSVISVFDIARFNYNYLFDDYDNYYGLEYFNTYPFSAGTIGIKPFYTVLNYKTSLKPPFDGNYSQLITTHKHTHSQLNAYVNESTLYFNGVLGIVYTENNKPSLKRKGLVYTCPREKLDNFCTINLDFTDLDNPGVSLIVDAETLIESYGISKEAASLSPVIWYKTKDFDLYSSGVNNWDDLICYNCEPDENGNLPTIHVPLQDIKDYLNIVGIELIDNIVNLNSLFSSSKNSASSILSASTELLSLVTSLYNGFSTPVKALILMVFLIGILIVFIRMIM